jgi:hypothetical protein
MRTYPDVDLPQDILPIFGFARDFFSPGNRIAPGIYPVLGAIGTLFAGMPTPKPEERVWFQDSCWLLEALQVEVRELQQLHEEISCAYQNIDYAAGRYVGQD